MKKQVKYSKQNNHKGARPQVGERWNTLLRRDLGMGASTKEDDLGWMIWASDTPIGDSDQVALRYMMRASCRSEDHDARLNSLAFRPEIEGFGSVNSDDSPLPIFGSELCRGRGMSARSFSETSDLSWDLRRLTPAETLLRGPNSKPAAELESDDEQPCDEWELDVVPHEWDPPSSSVTSGRGGLMLVALGMMSHPAWIPL
jgi:hypothetical protein